MNRKIFALLALVGLAALPSWATTWVTTLSVAVNGEGGTVTVSNGGTQTSTSGSFTSSATHTYTITATPNNGYLFSGWFESESAESPFSTDAQTTREVKVSSTSYDSRTGSLAKGYTYTKSGGTVYAKFEERPAVVDLSEVNFSLSATSFNFDGTTKSVTESVTYGGNPLVRGTHYTITEDTLSGAGSAAEDTTYTVTITAIDGSGYTGTKSATWTIKAPSGSFDANALSTSASGCTASGNAASVSDSAALAYDSAKNVWIASMTINWPAPTKKDYTWTDYGTATYIDAAHAFVAAQNGETYSGAQVLDAGTQTPGLSATTGEDSYNYALGQSKKFTYFKDLTFTTELTVDDIEAAKKAGTSLDYAVTVWSVVWQGGDNNTCGSAAGLKATTYTLTVTIGDDFPLTLPENATCGLGDGTLATCKILMNKGAKVTSTSELDTTRLAVASGIAGYQINASGAYAYTCEATQYPITYTYTGHDGKTPTNPNAETYTVEDEITFAAASLDGYIFNGWTPASIAKGTTGDQSTEGSFSKIYARIGEKNYPSLIAALADAKDGDMITLAAALPEADTNTVPLGVTLDLGEYGHADSAYYLTGAESNTGATLISKKKEKVFPKGEGVADNFFEVIETEDSGTYTYTLQPNHEHMWGKFELNGNVLTTTCTNGANTCTVPGAQLAVTLEVSTVSKEYDGNGFTATLSDTTDFIKYLTDGDKHTVNVGEVTIERPSYSTEKWYAGAYTAKCVITIDGEEYTLTQGVTITKPQNGYTDGFEAMGIGGYDVRFDTFGEAVAVAEAGATIYYRSGNWNADSFTASASKDITLDLGGKTLTHSETKAAASDLTIKNDGVGTVTLVHGTIQQPVGQTWSVYHYVDVYYGVIVSGKFVFGNDLIVTKQGDSVTVTANDSLAVVDGKYQSAFAGKTEISGGVFTVKPTLLAPDHIVREISGDYKYEVVEHHHNVVYSAAENVITATCDADDHEFCGYGSPTVTLTAENEKVSGQPYSSAHVAVTSGFPVTVTDADITYWQNDQQLGSEPTETGDYVAKVTAGGVTAVAAFKIFHEHDYMIEKTDDVTLTATCQAGGTCDAPTRTLKLVAESCDWQKGTVFAASLEDGFGEAIAYTVNYVYKQGGETIAAPKLTGEYTVEATVTIAETPYVLTKAFAITKPAGGYTAGYEVKGADGEESKWICYDTFADAVAAAEERGTVVWHEGGNDQRQSTFDFKSDKDITVDLSGKNFSYDSDGHVTIKNSGSGRVTLINGTLRTAGTFISFNHDIYLQGKLTLGEGISVVKYSDVSTAGLDIREGADVILAGGTYRGTLKVEDNSALTITGGKYNTYYSSAMTTYVPDRGDKYVVRSISEDSGNLRYYVVPHTHDFKTSASGNVLTVKCEGTDSDLCNFGKGATITLTAANALAVGTQYEGASVDNQVTGDWAEKLPEAAALSVDNVVYYAAGDEMTPLEGAPTDAGDYVATLTYDEQTARATFSILPADLANGTFELNWTTIAYDGQPHANDIKTAKIGETDIVLGRDFEVSGDDFTQIGSPAEDKTYTVTLTGIGNFTGTTNLSWTITTLGDTAKFGKPAIVGGNYGKVEGTTLTVTNSSALAFDDEADEWKMTMTVGIPLTNSGRTYTFTPEALVRTDSENVTVDQGDQISAGMYEGQYKAKSFTWTEKITVQDVEKAIEAGDETIVRTAKVYALAYSETVSIYTLTNDGGLREVEFKMELPLADLVLPVPAGATLDMAGTKFASSDEYENYPYQLQLGVGAKVYGDPEVDAGYIYNEDGLTTTVAGYEVSYVEIPEAPEGECAYYFTTLPIDYNINYSFVDEDGDTLTDVTNPYVNKTTYTVEEEVLFTEPASLDGYEFVGWSPEKIEKGTTGEQTITGTFKKSNITIKIVQGDEITDVLTNGESIVEEEIELPAGTTQVKLTLEADLLTVPLFKVVRGNVTNVTSKTATYDIADGDTLEFFAEEAADDPQADPVQIKRAIIEAIDPAEPDDPDDEERYQKAVDKVNAIVGDGEGQVSAKVLAGYIADNNISSVDMAQCDYVAASAKLNADDLIDEETEVEIVEFAMAEGNAMTFEVEIDGWEVEVEAIKDMVAASSDFSDWETYKLEVEATFNDGKVTITPKDATDKAFLKIVIPKDSEK